MHISRFLIKDFGKCLFLPAHSRGDSLPNDFKELLKNRAGIWDIPDLPQFGSPLDENSIVAMSQKKSAEEVGVDHAWYGVNGASGLLQAAILSLARPGEAVLMPRNAHRSLIQACVIGNLIPILFDLPFDIDKGHYLQPDRDWLKKVLCALPKDEIKVVAAVLVHPTYNGYSIDLTPLIKDLHKKGLTVLVDEAHGSYFASKVDNDLPKSAIHSGADLVVHSLHKSANALVQSSVLWSQGSRVDPNVIRKSIYCLQTSSTSALLLASCESAIREWSDSVGREKLKQRIQEARCLYKKLIQAGIPLVNNQDPLRIILQTSLIGLTGFEVDSWLTSKGLIAELPEPGCITLCLGFSSHKGLEKVITSLWHDLLIEFPERLSLPSFAVPPLPFVSSPKVSLALAWRSSNKTINLKDSISCISAEIICPYPPGIPFLIPGEELDRRRVEWLIDQQKIWGKCIPSEISVIS